jgi:hypothetical protein
LLNMLGFLPLITLNGCMSMRQVQAFMERRNEAVGHLELVGASSEMRGSEAVTILASTWHIYNHLLFFIPQSQKYVKRGI